jgi:hypothetical protein
MIQMGTTVAVVAHSSNSGRNGQEIATKGNLGVVIVTASSSQTLLVAKHTKSQCRLETRFFITRKKRRDY